MILAFGTNVYVLTAIFVGGEVVCEDTNNWVGSQIIERMRALVKQEVNNA